MDDLPQTRRSLLIALGQRSDHAWTEFLRVYEQALQRFCRARGLQDADARDVTQEVLAEVHQRLSSWDPDASKGSFRAWLFRVARNLSVDEITRRARRATGSGDPAVHEFLGQVSGPPSAPGELPSLDAEVQRSLLEWASARVRREVRPGTWLCFQRTAVEGQAPERVASDLGLSVGSVYTAKCRVVARIRARIAELDGSIPSLHD